jgi:predicted RNA-binding protein with RPS1 domain
MLVLKNQLNKGVLLMATLTVEKGKWVKLGKKLEKIVTENNLKSKSEKKPLKQIFTDFAKDNDTTYGSTQQYYYSELRPRMKTQKDMSFDDKIEAYNRLNTAEKEFRNVRDVHKIGDIVEIEIISIMDFGVFGRTTQGYEGLLHISQITGREYVTLPEDYFYIGEKVKAKVIRYDGDKISFSTRAIGGKEKINPAFRDLATKKVEKIEKKEVKPEPKPQTQQRKAKVLQSEAKPKVSQPESKPITNNTSATNNDKDNIIQFIKRYSDNTVSPKALGDIDDLIAEHGVFQTTMSLMSTVRDLDISSFITEMTKERLEGERLRQ